MKFEGHKYRSEIWLRKQYIDENRSLTDIADSCNVSTATIMRWRDKLNIQKKKQLYESEHWLREQYIDKDRSLADMARECDVTHVTIRNWLNKFGIYKGNQCPLCEFQSESLGNHLSQASHDYPDIDQYKWEILVGHIMGDAWYELNGKNGYLAWKMTNLDYMKWINRELEWLCYDPYLKLTPEEAAQENFLREVDHPPHSYTESHMLSGDPSHYKPQYQSHTVSHPLINKLNWIEDGKKRFPETLRLTPTMVKVWYCDDGGLHWKSEGNRRPNAVITASSQIDILDSLADKFEDVVCRPVVSNNKLRFNADETEKLLYWMGEYPPGMEYKFCLESKEKYDELKP